MGTLRMFRAIFPVAKRVSLPPRAPSSGPLGATRCLFTRSPRNCSASCSGGSWKVEARGSSVRSNRRPPAANMSAPGGWCSERQKEVP